MNWWYLRHLACLVLSLALCTHLGQAEESVYLRNRNSLSELRSDEWKIKDNDQKLLIVFKLLESSKPRGEILTAYVIRDKENIVKLQASLDENTLNISLYAGESIIASTESVLNLSVFNQISIEIDNENKYLECKINPSESKKIGYEVPLSWENSDVEVVLGSRHNAAITGCISLFALQIGDEVFNSAIKTGKNVNIGVCGDDQSCEKRNCGEGRCIQQHIGICDCYDTGKSGTSCERDATTIELNNAGEGLDDKIYFKGSGEPLRRFAMQFKLKGPNEGVLAYAFLRNREIIKICVVESLGTVNISPNMTIKFDLNPEKVFHKLELLIDKEEGVFSSKLIVDGVRQEVPISSDLLLNGIMYGAAPADEGVADVGFTGCFRELYMNEYDIIHMAFTNHTDVVLTNPPTQCSNHGPTSDSVIVNGVKLIPPEDAPTNEGVLMSDDADEDEIVSTTGKEPLVLQCENMQKTFCQNEADCLVINGKPQCLCQPGYAGSYCQFVLLPRTCAEAKAFHHQRDGPTIIDLDGSSHLRKAITVCDNGHSIVSNNLPPNTLIRSAEQKSWIFRLSYLDFLEIPKLSALVTQSGTCEQEVKYECNRARLNFNSSHTYFRVATNNQTVTQIGRDNGTCQCHDFHNCLHDGLCNCDAFGTAQDEGVLRGTQAGITEIVSLNIGGSVSGRLTVGPLNCSGFAGERDSFQFTKDAELAFTEIRDVTQVSMQFKTSANNGIILTIGQTVVELMDAYTIRVVQGEKSVVLGSQTKLNNSIWHLLRLEWLHDDFLVSVDSHFAVSTEITKQPDHLVVNSLERGFYGCVRSIVVNNELLELEKFARERKLEYKQCSEHCSHIRCQNEAECIEDYQKDEAACRCVYPDIQSGATCEIDINHHSSISFHGGYLTYENITNPLVENTVFSFRTDQSNALLFYAHDHLRNFIQVHLRDEVNLTLTLNRDREIHSCTLSAQNGDEFSHMQWIQIAIKHIDNEYTQLLVKGEACIIRAPLQLSTSLITQYNNWNVNDGVEIPIGLDSSAIADPTLKIFVGGVTDVESENEVVHKLRPSYRAKLPNLLGCMRGLKIGNQIIDIRDRTFGISPEDSSLVRLGCEVGCDTLTCYNGGHCSIGWRNYDPSASKTSCDCTRTSYVGESCTDDNGMLLSNQLVAFNITSLMARFVDPPLRGQSLKFAFSPSAAKIHSRQVIAVLEIDDRLLEIILNKNSSLNVAIHDSEKSQVVTFKGNFTDGYRHFFVARFGPNIVTSVMVDSSRQSFSHERSSFLDLRRASEIIVGGRGVHLADYTSAGLKTNYEGCISNLELNIGEGTKPLEFHLMDRLDESVSNYPIERGRCSSFRIPNQPPVLQNTVNLPLLSASLYKVELTGVGEPSQNITFWLIVLGVLLFILFLVILCLVCMCCRWCRNRDRHPEIHENFNKPQTKFDIPVPEGELLLGRPSQRSGIKEMEWAGVPAPPPCWYSSSTAPQHWQADSHTDDISPRYLSRFWRNSTEGVPVPVSSPSCPSTEQ